MKKCFQLSCENYIFAFSHENSRNLYYLSSNKSEIIGQYERGRAIKARPLLNHIKLVLFVMPASGLWP